MAGISVRAGGDGVGNKFPPKFIKFITSQFLRREETEEEIG